MVYSRVLRSPELHSERIPERENVNMTFRSNLFCCVVFLCTALTTRAQQADFSPSATSGCSPLTVIFTNQSTGISPTATYSWDFGNTNSSTKENPGALYEDEGDYTVTLTVTDGGKSSSKSIGITVYKKPVVDFSVDITKGCAPLAVTFTSHSLPGDGTISSYTWDFGDGIAEKGEEVQPHVYNVAKLIGPSLTVTNSHGCYSTLPKKDLIEVLPIVLASFSPNKTVLCNVQDPLLLTNTSAGTGTLAYSWDFGDGATSTLQLPQHIYSQPGTYPVKLSAVSRDGCVSDTVITINAGDYHTNFTLPDIICQNTEVLLEDKSTPAPTTENWLINGAPFFDTVPLQLHHTFTSPGEYDVKLSNVYETCPDVSAKRITVQPSPVNAGFQKHITGSCGAPVTVEFRDTTAGAVSWSWDFTGDGTALGSGQTTSHFYEADSTYQVTLKVTNSNGCSALVTQPVVVHKSTVTIASSTGDIGCETKETVFSAVSEEPVTQFLWNFGDGGTSTEATPDHLFTAPGKYDITLDYVTASGCKGRANYTIHVYEKPQFDFTSIPGTNICGSNPVSFDVTGSNLIGTYYWMYGDTNEYIINNKAPYLHSYQRDSLYSVSLIIDNNGCSDTVTKTDYLTVVPPFPHISHVANTCSGDRGLVTFQDTSYKSESYSWDFGDGTPPDNYTSAQPQVQHQYKASGHYIVSLLATAGTCSASDTISLYVLLKQAPLLSASITKFCSSDTFHTAISGMDANPHTNGLGYDVTAIQYDDNTLFKGTAALADSSGRSGFNINLTPVDPTKSRLRIITTSQYFGCTDTTDYLAFEALGPVAGFSLKENNVCFKTPVLFTDKSEPTHNSPIVKWTWSYGDSTTQTNIQGTSVSHWYPDPGTYIAVLTVTDANGCSASTPANTGYVTIKGPKAAFTVSPDVVLPQTDVSFHNGTNTLNTNSFDNTYTWLYGDGTSIAKQPYMDPVTHSYAAEGIDTVTLIASNAVEHCADTTSQVVYVQNPNLSFTYTTSFINPGGGCPPVIANFTSTSKNTLRVSWDFGDGNTADQTPAGHVYEKPGIYKVVLYGYFVDGSKDSVFRMVTIKGPYAVLSAVKPFACGSEPITLTAASANTRNFTWDFGDGTLVNNSDTFATHRYLTPNIYTPSLIVSDGSNCRFSFFPAKPIIIDTLDLQINKQEAITCDSSLLLFKPTTLSLAKDSLHLPLIYHWNFGTGKARDTAGTENSSFIYKGPGRYEVILGGSSPYGCTDIARDTLNIQPMPRAFIAGTPKICEGDTALFTGSATREVTWSWQFGNGNTSALQNPFPQVYTKPGVDSVSLIVNDNGCYDTAWHRLTVNAKPAINPSPLSAHLCQNDSVQLQAHDGTSYQWTPKQHISGSSTATPYVHPDTATTYFVEVKNAAGCVSQDSVSITVTPRFTVTAPSPVYICPGGLAQLNASGADTYHWLGDGLSNADIANPTTSVYEPKLFTVIGADKYGCFTDTTTAQVLTATLPTAEAGADITTYAGTEAALHATGSSDIVHWEWLPATSIYCDTCAATTLTPHADMQYVLKVTNSSGCVGFDSLQVVILCKASRITIPSAFTPNGDGRNDYFTVLGRGIREVQQFAVFDRYGEKLYEASHLDVGESSLQGWNGIYQGKPMPAGTYVYIANIVCDTGEVFPYKGTVVLIR